MLFPQRRATLFDSSVRPFVDYFQKSGRLVNIDVSCGMLDLIWSRMCEVFSDLQLTNCANADTVIIFAFGECLQLLWLLRHPGEGGEWVAVLPKPLHFTV